MRKTLTFTLVLVILIGLCACGLPEKAIVGTWKSQDAVLGVETEIKFIFNKDGTGKISTAADIDFTYAFSNDKLIITTTILGYENDDEYFYEFNGDKLVLFTEKDTFNLEKVKK